MPFLLLSQSGLQFEIWFIRWEIDPRIQNLMLWYQVVICHWDHWNYCTPVLCYKISITFSLHLLKPPKREACGSVYYVSMKEVSILEFKKKNKRKHTHLHINRWEQYIIMKKCVSTCAMSSASTNTCIPVFFHWWRLTTNAKPRVCFPW